jgi:hypothetical protein
VANLFYGPNCDFQLDVSDIYIVWFCNTLKNWKALVSTNAKDDAYYEVTYNGEKDETYIDRYVKESNTVVRPDRSYIEVTLVNTFTPVK